VIDLITEPHWFANTMLMAHISATRQQIFFMVLNEEEGEVDVLLGVFIVEGLVVKFLCVEGIVIGAGAVKVRPVVLGGLMAFNTGLGLSNTSLIVVDPPLAGLDAEGGVDGVEAGVKDLHVNLAIALEFLCAGGAELASTTCCLCCRWWYPLFLFLYFASSEMHVQHLPDLCFVMHHLQ